MAVTILDKVAYSDHVTKIPAENMNEIQEAIIEAEEAINDMGNATTLSYTVVSTF